MTFLAVIILFFNSCAKDNDLFDEYVLAPDEEEVVEPDDSSGEDSDGETNNEEEENPDDGTDPDDGSDPDQDNPFDGIDFTTPDNPENTNRIEGSYTPTSMADITNPANANLKAIISESFECNGCTFAAEQTIEPAGGVISGSNIDLNGAYIINTYKQAFAPSATFNQVYTASRISPELFGANAGDNLDDTDAIDAMINNVQLAVTADGGIYIKNKPSDYKRSGSLDWNMNGATVKTTSSSNFDITKVSVDFIFYWSNISPSIYNGEFDGTRSYGRLMYLDGQEYFRFNNLWIHDYYSPTTIRAKAFQINLRPVSKGFVYGEFSENTIENIIAEGDGNYNNSPAGVAKGWSYGVYEINDGNPFTVIHKDNKVFNIIGDDAEALYMIDKTGGKLNHNSKFVLEREDYRYCTRRAVKANVSNVTVIDSYFEEIPESMFQAAQQMGSLVDFFSIDNVNMIQDIVFKRNTLKSTSDSAHYHFLSLSEVDRADISDNIIEHANIENYAGIRLGSGTSTYDGKLRDIKITNNQFINCGIQVLQRYAPVNNQPIVVDGNTFYYAPNLNDSWGQQQSALRFSASSGNYGYVNFSNSTINIELSGTSSIFNGAISSLGANVVGCKIENIKVDYISGGVNRPFGYLQGSFDSSNTIINCSLVGAIGTGAIDVKGSNQSATIESSTDSSGNPITIE
jgi:hypothetical protein